MEKYIVTGGAGFIGSHFIERLLKNGASVINIDSMTYAGNETIITEFMRFPKFKFVQCSIGDTEKITDLFAEHRPMAIINFAAETHVDRSIEHPERFIQTNILDTQKLFSTALQYWDRLSNEEKSKFRFLQVSTDEVYGSIAKGAATEDAPLMPNSPYAASKAGGDLIARANFKTYGLPIIIARSSNNYGPRQFPEKLIPLTILNCLENKELPVYGDGLNQRDWLFVEDNCAALEAILANGVPGQIYNVGGLNELDNLFVVRSICNVLDSLRPPVAGKSSVSLIRMVADRPAHDRRYSVNCTRLRKEVGWEPSIGFEKGLRHTIEWYVQNRLWWEDIRAKKYSGERLGMTYGKDK